MLPMAAAVALMSLLAGCCSQTGQLARAQGPAPAPDAVVGKPVSEQVGDEVCYEGEEECDECDGMSGGRGYGGRCANWCVPYHVPHDYVFPVAGPPATVQYPYYTCKGPDCFFHQQ